MFTGQVLAGRDVYRLFIPDANYLLRCIQQGQWPLWNPYERLGQPFLATMYSQVLYPPHLIAAAIGGSVWSITIQQVFNSVVAAAGTYVFMKRIEASFQAALLAASAFSIGPMMVHLGIQQNVASAAAWTGFILMASVDMGQAATLKNLMKLSVFFTMSLLSGSPETLIWQGMLSISLILTFGFRKKTLALFSASTLWAALMGAIILLPAARFAMQAVHASSASERFQWSAPAISLLSMGWFGADLPKPTYSGGEQNFIPTVFLGTLVVALWLAALFLKKRSWIARILAFGGAFFAILAMGSHFWPSKILLNLPPFSLFRYPSKYLVAASFCIAASAGLGLDRLAGTLGEIRSRSKRIVLLAAPVGLIIALTQLGVRLLPMRRGAASGAIWLSAFLFLGATVLLLIKTERNTHRLKWALLGLVLLELAASHFVLGSQYWLPARDMEPASTFADYLPEDFNGRVSVVILGKCAATKTCMTKDKTYNIRQSLSVLVPRRNTELRVHGVDGYGAPIPARIERVMHKPPRAVYDMVGAEYFVRRGSQPFADLQEVIHPEGMPGLWRSTTAMPRAWVVQKAKIVTSEQAFEALVDPAEPGRSTVFLEQGKAIDGKSCESRVVIEDEGPNHLTMHAKACADGYLVISDQYFPGWHARINGQYVDVLQANYIMRALAIKKGDNKVEMRYKPWTFTAGAWLSLMALLALVATSFESWRKARQSPRRAK